MRRLRIILVIGLMVLAGLGPMVQPAPATAQTGPEPGSLAAMFQLMPLAPGGNAQATITYTNPALQAETVGVATPGPGPNDPGIRDWARTQMSLPTHSLAPRMASPDWYDTFGFGLTDVYQAAEYSAPPSAVSVLRGRFDPEALITRWVETGYEARQAGQAIFYSIGDDFEINIQSPVGRMALANANYLAVLDGETIAFASTEALIVAALEASAGTGRSLADEINIASLLAGAPDDLAGATIIPGSVLMATGNPGILIGQTGELPDPDDLATQIADEMAAAAAMPALTYVLLGSTAGGPIADLDHSFLAPDDVPVARAVAVAATTSIAAAETAAGVIDARLRASTGALDWSEFFSGWDIETVAGEPAVRVEFEMAPGRNPGVLSQMLFQRQLSFLEWLP